MTDDKIKVLALEDDPGARELLMRQLMAHGMDVVLVRDGLEGLTRLESFSPDVIVCDIEMPGLDGLEFVKTIKSKDETRAIPVIFLTADDDPKTRSKGLDAGARYYLKKPLRVDNLVTKIKDIVARK